LAHPVDLSQEDNLESVADTSDCSSTLANSVCSRASEVSGDDPADLSSAQEKNTLRFHKIQQMMQVWQ